MRVILGVTGFLIFCFALGFGWWLLDTKQLSGTEFVAFTVAFTIIGGIVSFAPEVQEFSIAGNIVKLREVKNDAIKSVEVLKRSQSELLRLLLRTKLFVSKSFFSYDRSHMAIDKDFWDIVSEAKKIDALKEIKPQLLVCVDGMVPVLYSIAARYVVDCPVALDSNKDFAEVAADLLGPNKVYGSSGLMNEDDGALKDFVRGRVSEIESL